MNLLRISSSRARAKAAGHRPTTALLGAVSLLAAPKRARPSTTPCDGHREGDAARRRHAPFSKTGLNSSGTVLVAEKPDDLRQARNAVTFLEDLPISWTVTTAAMVDIEAGTS
jgi:hypothetical protein